MRRGLRLVVVLAGICVIAIIVIATSTGSSYRVAAIFDTADGIVPGSQVKIAGAAVGTVSSVQLTTGPKARIVFSLPARLRPFHTNASCTILPEGIISETFVECSPGSARTPPLRSGPSGLTTVSLAHTTIPASLQDLINVFSMPQDDRLRVLINELGITLAGRGASLNAMLQRSNPALTQAQRVLAIIAAQRTQLVSGIQQMAGVLSSLGQRTAAVHAFVDGASTVAATAAAHRQALSQTVARLPGLLDAAQPGLASLNHAIVHATPLLDRLHAAAPELLALTRAVPQFTEAAPAALDGLASASRTGIRAIPVVLPVIHDLASASQQAVPFATNFDNFLISTRNAGGIEGLEEFIYELTTALGAEDNVSHVATAFIRVFPQCFVASLAGCDSAYTGPGQGRIPPDDPACGEQAGAPWSPLTNCIDKVSVTAIRHKSPLSQRTAPPQATRTATPPAGARPATPGPTKPAAGAGTPTAGTTGARGISGLLSTLGGVLGNVHIPIPPPSAPPSSVSTLLRYLIGK